MNQGKHNKLRECLIALLIFLVVGAVHYKSPCRQFADARWFVYVSMSLIRQGNLDLDEYASNVSPSDYRVITKNGHLYSRFPPGTALLAVPAVFLTDRSLWHGYGFNLNDYLLHHGPDALVANINVLIASLIVGLTTVLIYKMGRMFLNISSALLLAFIFSFCTSAWSSASRDLWQNCAAMFMLTLSLYLLLRYPCASMRYGVMLLPLFCAVFIRPVSIVHALVFSAYLVTGQARYRGRVFAFVLVSLMLWLVFASSLSLAYSHNREWHSTIAHTGRLFAGGRVAVFLGNLLSPNRGLFVFTPIFLFSIAGIVNKARNNQLVRLDYFVAAAILLHWIAVSFRIRAWWGGYSFGPRYFTEITPYLVYFLIPVIKDVVSTEYGNVKRMTVAFVFCSLMAMSLFVHFRGASRMETWRWNATPVSVDEQPSRIWDWNDIQFLR